ncbi:MAG: LptF/LptG family permease [Acidobacteria bacterium]|jgi:lipopolysaccharide export LptBFGC system permease protein LptF|nr:MAG: LptF/LptG family permease [Acidobacteriota bacterium]
MLFLRFSWRFIRLGFFISLLFTFLLFIVQLVRLDQILLRLPLYDSLPFLFLWNFYYFSYFLPTALFISYSFTLFEFKESRKLHIAQSFGVSPKNFYIRSLLYCLPIILSLFVSSLLVKEEDIGNLRRQLSLKYYTLMVTSVPPGTFHSIDQLILYVERREGKFLEGVFFRYPEGVVVARRAFVEGESIVFEGGSVVTFKEGKTYTTEFKRHRLSLAGSMGREKNKNKSTAIGILNSSSLPMLLFLGYLISKRVEHHQRLYYTIGIASVFYQAFLVLLKQSL